MLESFSNWLAATALSQLFASTSWFVPTVQTVHILAIAAIVTAIAMINIRLLGVVRRGPDLPHIARSFLPWVWIALAVLFVTGVLLTITEPARELQNGTFWLKMLLIVALVLLTLLVQRSVRRDPGYFSSTSGRRRLGAAIGAANLLLCAGIVAAGRLIAYT
ncbi:MAG: hypothetical protein DIU56_006705 [Pseudomonadota bacterium]|jgi:hypothetical protein|nr:MAG: hypothetical protein DIU56_00350 [Pseudomonadota bacterium]